MAGVGLLAVDAVDNDNVNTAAMLSCQGLVRARAEPNLEHQNKLLL